MEQSKQSDKQIIELGKTLVSELNLDYSNSTLARWMSHHLSELIINIENSESEIEKKELKKECCELIIELWDKRERIPFEKPTERLKPIIAVLELLKQKEHPFIPFIFPDKQKNTKSKSWVEFLKIIKANSESIFNKSLISMIHDKVLEKDNKWVKKHGEFLSEEEKKMIEYLNHIKRLEVNFNVNSNDKLEEESDAQKLKVLFSELENFIDEQKEALLNLKSTLIPIDADKSPMR